MEEYDTLVLSGGGIKGFSLLGGVQAIIDSGKFKNIDKFIGTSAGALICYLLAIGYTPMEIIVSLYTNKWLEKMQYFNLVAMINGNGATSFNNISEALEKLTLDKIGILLTLGKLKELYGKTLICCTYNMSVCASEYLGPDNYPDLPCLTALRMTSNIPLVFDRFKYMDNYYIDGGIVDNFPILKGEEIGNKIIGICLKLEESSLKDVPEDGLISYFIKLLQIPVVQSTQNKIAVVNKEKSTIVMVKNSILRNMIEFDVKSKIRLDLFSDGYRDTKNILNISF